MSIRNLWPCIHHRVIISCIIIALIATLLMIACLLCIITTGNSMFLEDSHLSRATINLWSRQKKSGHRPEEDRPQRSTKTRAPLATRLFRMTQGLCVQTTETTLFVNKAIVSSIVRWRRWPAPVRPGRNKVISYRYTQRKCLVLTIGKFLIHPVECVSNSQM